jgi:hypothetical protein
VSHRSLLCALFALSLASPALAAPQRDGVYLVNDLAFAREEARKTGKPIFVVFRCEV